ncbi:MAG: isocitrate lyase/PEP mutase family protein [Chloroflexota bacterium]|nr:isocitrate lyase/PEP mutase family protein [Chloroflexota bacterium]
MTDRRDQLAERIREPGTVVLPGVYDALTARLAQRAGFHAIFATGAGISNTHLGQADVALLTMDELVRTVSRIGDVTGIPLIVDADTGFGGYLNLQRTVRELERAGAAAMTLEDQVFPKRCGHFDGKRVAPSGEMVARLQAALDARVDRRFLIVARTDARANEGIEGAIARMHRYFEVGADVGFVEAPRTVEEVRAVAAAFPQKPLLLNLVEGGKTPLFSAAELNGMGYKFMLCANTVLRAAIKGVTDALALLKEDGSQARAQSVICSWEERQGLVESARLMEMERHYLGIAEGE